jgi:hypothetical protein
VNPKQACQQTPPSLSLASLAFRVKSLDYREMVLVYMQTKDLRRECFEKHKIINEIEDGLKTQNKPKSNPQCALGFVIKPLAT